MILRAGYGRETSQKDRKFDEFYTAAKAVGLHIGAYWYSYADSVEDAAKEANACLTCLQGKQFDFPVYYDLEEGSTAALGKAVCTQIAQTFCTAIEQAGYWAGVYANTNWFTNYLNFDSLAAKYTIWLADYREAYNTTLKRDMHQYSSTGGVAPSTATWTATAAPGISRRRWEASTQTPLSPRNPRKKTAPSAVPGTG